MRSRSNNVFNYAGEAEWTPNAEGGWLIFISYVEGVWDINSTGVGGVRGDVGR